MTGARLSEAGAETSATEAGEPVGLSYAEAGAEIGVTKQRIGALVAQGRIPLLPSGKIDAAAWRLARQEAADRAAAAVGAAGGGAGSGAGARPALSAREQRDELALLRETAEFLEKARRLTDAAAAETATLELFRRLRDSFLVKVARRIGEECAGEDAPRALETKAKGIMAEELSAFADELEAIADDAEPLELAGEREAEDLAAAERREREGAGEDEAELEGADA